MSKKLITACLGLVALAAFALPPVASAENKPVLTHPTGTKALKGILLLGTGLGAAKVKNEAGTTTLAECSTAVMRGSLVQNESGAVEGNITTATFSGGGAGEHEGMDECKGVSILPHLTATTNGTHSGNKLEANEDVEKGTPYCLRSTTGMSTNEFQVRGGTCSEASRAITIVFDTTGLGTCRYTRSEAIKGTFATDTTAGDAVMSIGPGGSVFKKEEVSGVLCPGAVSLEMTFTLETDTTPASPVYISKLP